MQGNIVRILLDFVMTYCFMFSLLIMNFIFYKALQVGELLLYN